MISSSEKKTYNFNRNEKYVDKKSHKKIPNKVDCSLFPSKIYHKVKQIERLCKIINVCISVIKKPNLLYLYRNIPNS